MPKLEPIDLCNDFYSWVCQSWIENKVNAQTTAFNTKFEEILSQSYQELKEVFTSPEDSPSKAIQMVKTLYRSCIDQNLMDYISARPLMRRIKAMGSWPMVDDSWEESKYHLTNLLVNTTITIHESIFFDVQNTPDFLKRDKNNTDKAMIHVMNLKSMFGEKFHEIYLDPEWHNEEIDIIREYLKMNVKHFMADAGISRNESDISDDIDEIIQFETQIVKLLKEASNNDPSGQLKFARISDLKEHFPLTNWEHFMVKVYPTALESYILHNPRIVIQDTSLLTRVSELVSKTEPRVIVNYVMLRYALSWNNEIGTKYELLWQALESNILHENKVEMRWKNCMDIATKTMSHATGAMWLREYFDKESKSIVDQIVTDIRMTFIEILNENKWMGNETKQAAIVKVQQMTKHIAYPELEINDKKLDKYYKHLHISPNLTFSDNYEEILNWHFVKGAYHILEPYEIEFITNSNDFEAEYIQEKNTIVISAPIIRAPFFDKDAPFSFNYAAIGSVIGHELIHGFDHEGMYYDEKGEYRDWWDEGSKNEFYRRAECIVRQYSRVKVVDKKHRIDGNQTLAENISDNGGIKIAHRIWCQNYEIRQQFHRLQSDEHSPGFARVNIPLANMPEFAKAYACPIGSRMNPSSRCTVWGDDVDPTTAYDDAKQIQMKEIAKLLLKKVHSAKSAITETPVVQSSKKKSKEEPGEFSNNRILIWLTVVKILLILIIGILGILLILAIPNRIVKLQGENSSNQNHRVPLMNS